MEQVGQIWPPNWAGFVPSVIATFMGALLGFLGAIQVNRWVQKRLEVKEAEQQRQRRNLVLQLLTGEISRNQERLSNMKSDLHRTTTIDYSVTLDVWRALSREVLEAISDNRVAQAVTQLYDCLSLVASTQGAYNRLVIAGGDDFAEARTERLPRLENLIERSVNLATVAAQGLNTELARLCSGK